MRFADSLWQRGPGDLRKTNEPVTTIAIKHRVAVVKYGGAETGDDEKYMATVEELAMSRVQGGERYRQKTEEKRLNIKFSRGNKLLFPLTICSVRFLLRQFTNFIPRIPLAASARATTTTNTAAIYVY